VIKWPVKLYVRFFTFFYVFFKIQKNMTFYVFFELLHTFSRTVVLLAPEYGTGIVWYGILGFNVPLDRV